MKRVIKMSLKMMAAHVLVIGIASGINWVNMFIVHPSEWDAPARGFYLIAMAAWYVYLSQFSMPRRGK